MKKEVSLGLDVGTSAVKCTAVELATGAVAGYRRLEYQRDDLDTGVVPVSMYVDVVKDLLDGLTQEFTVRSLAITTAMYSVVGIKDGVRYAYQWNCPWERNLEAEQEARGLLDGSGCYMDILYPVYKLMTAKVRGDTSFRPYGFKECLIESLTGEKVIDFGTGSASGLLDIRKKTWNRPLMDKLGFSDDELPRLEYHNVAVGETTINGQTILVVPGMGDGISASYAGKDTSEVAANVGTTMAARELSTTVRHNALDKLWTLIDDKTRYVNGAISSNGGSVLNWARKSNWPIDDVRVQQGGERFYPWLHGERTPFWSADLRGTLTGMDMRTDSASISSAMLKGVAFTLTRMINGIVRARGDNPNVVVAGGGVHMSELVRVMQGSVDVPLTIVSSFDYLASEGAALSAGEALDIPPTKFQHEIERVLEPTGEFRDDYDAWINEGNTIASAVYDVEAPA